MSTDLEHTPTTSHGGRDRRRAERRVIEDRRVEAVPVEIDRRVSGRRFLERRAEIRRRLNDRRHLLR